MHQGLKSVLFEEKEGKAFSIKMATYTNVDRGRNMLIMNVQLETNT